MNPDCSDIRIVHEETNQELRYFLESGENSPTTYLWLKGPEQSLLTKRFSQLDESTYYVTFGDRDRASVSDSSVLFDYYEELNRDDLAVWITATDLASQTQDGEAITSWPNAGARPPSSPLRPIPPPSLVRSPAC